MDIATGVGLVGGVATVVILILIDGGNFAGYFDKHAVIVIFGGATAATMVRFPFSVIMHGLPMGIRFAFSLRSSHPRDLIEELTKIADVVRKSGPMALENIQVDDTFLAQGIRYVCRRLRPRVHQGHDGARPRYLPAAARRGLQGLPRLRGLRAGLGHGRHHHRHGDHVRQHVRSLQARPGHGDGAARHPLRRADRQHGLPAPRRQAAHQARGRGHLPLAHHRRHPAHPRVEESRRSSRKCSSPTCRSTTAPSSRKPCRAGSIPWPGRNAAAVTAVTAGSSPSPTSWRS